MKYLYIILNPGTPYIMTKAVNFRNFVLVTFFLLFGFSYSESIAQPCECINCPGTIPKAGLQDFSTTEFLYFVNGASSNSLDDPFQGVCAVNVVFKADNVFQVEMYLISPGGDTVRLIGPDAGSGVGVTALTTWNVTFMPNAIAVFPDPGFSPVWTNYDPWETGAMYNGSYHPSQGKLEDFDNGPVNGPWRLVVKNYAPINKGEVIDFSIVFCDETGIECGCLAYAGIYPSFKLIEACEGSDSLKLNIKPNYNGYEPDSNVFNYSYTIASPKNVILEFTESPDLSAYPVGNYKVCGLSYLKADSAMVIKDAGTIKLDSIYKEINSPDPKYCADLSKNCYFININPPPPPVNVEAFLCQDSCYIYKGKSYCQPGNYTFTEVDSVGCTITYNLKLEPAATKYHSYTDTICVGEFVIFGVDFYNKTGVYTKTFKSFTGCDSIVTLNLKVINFNLKIAKPDTLNCLNSTVLLDGSDINEGNPACKYTWSASAGGQVNGNGDTPDLLVDKAGTYKLTATFTLASGKTCSDFISVNVVENFIQPELSTVPDQFLCLGDELDLSKLSIKEIHGMQGVLSFHSAVPPSTLNQISPIVQPSSSGVYYAHFVAGSCDAIKQINVNVNQKPKAEVKSLANICNSGVMGQSTVIDFDTLIVSGDNQGFWVDSDNSGASGTFPNLDFNGVMPGTYEFIYFTQSAIPPCTDTFYIVSIIVEDCACPSLATLSPGDMCQNSADINLNALLVTTESGTWTLENAPPGATATVMGNTFTGTGSMPGSYGIRFTLNQMPPAGCPEFVDLSFKIILPPELQIIQDVTICNSGDMGAPTSLDFSQLIFSADKTGVWKDLDNSGAVGAFPVLDFKNISPGKYRFKFETGTAVFPCKEATDTVTVNVQDCECPTVSLADASLCNTEDTLDLNTLVLTGQAGTWQIISSPPGTNAASLLQNNLLVKGRDGGKYDLNFTLSNPTPGCPAAFGTSVHLVAAPVAVLDTVVSICNSNENGNVSLLDFTNLLKGGDVSGLWQQVTASGASGTLPLLDFDAVLPGSYYFRYITNSAVTPCPETEYLVRVIVEDCSCPSVATVSPGKYCNDNASVNLDNFKITTESGSWAIIMNPPGVNPATVVLNTFNGTNADPGIYTLQFILQNSPPVGCPTFSTQTIELVENPNAVLTQTVSVCNDAASGNVSVLDFSSLILSGNMNGVWSDVNNSGAQGAFPVLDFTGVTPGVYTFRYAISASAPCFDKSFDVMVEVKDCKCPSVLVAAFPDKLCNDGISLDLNNYFSPGVVSTLIAVPGGQSASILQNNILQLQDIVPGTYTILAAFQSVPAGCKQDTLLNIEVSDMKSAGAAFSDLSFCVGTDTIISILDLLTDADPGGVWTLQPTSSALNSINGSLDVSLLPAADYVLKYSQSNMPPCTPDEALINISIHPLPVADAGEDKQTGCSNSTVTLGGALNASLTDVSFLWSGNLPDYDKPNPETDIAGTYILTVTDLTTGCSSSDEVVVTEGADQEPEVEVKVQQPDCKGNIAPSITVNVISGNPPYLFSINNGAFQPENTFTQLNAGNYYIQIEDASGCTSDTTVEIFSALSGGIKTGNDTIINFGDSLFVEPVISFPYSDIASVKWTGQAQINCDTCLYTWLKPFKPTKFFVEVITKAGCIYKADIIVSVKKELKYFVPNVFSPNGDGVNDRVEINLGRDIAGIKEFRMFDRWGEQVFFLENVPNEGVPVKAWDGIFNGRRMNSGVFVYMLSVVLPDGTTELFTGETTLVN